MRMCERVRCLCVVDGQVEGSKQIAPKIHYLSRIFEVLSLDGGCDAEGVARAALVLIDRICLETQSSPVELHK